MVPIVMYFSNTGFIKPEDFNSNVKSSVTAHNPKKRQTIKTLSKSILKLYTTIDRP
jgi:hypothetical protein